jgi:GTPase
LLVSALTGEGADALLTAIEARLAVNRPILHLVLDAADGAGASWLHRNTEVLEKSVTSDDRIAMTVRADTIHADMARRKFEVAGG